MKQTIFLAMIFLSTSTFAAELSRPLITGVSHIAVYAANPAATERYYVHDLRGFKGKMLKTRQACATTSRRRSTSRCCRSRTVRRRAIVWTT